MDFTFSRVGCSKYIRFLAIATLLAKKSSARPQLWEGILGTDAMKLQAPATIQNIPVIWYPTFTPVTQKGFPAPKGADFEGPDPGLNAAITFTNTGCPENHFPDQVGICRLRFGSTYYGPNPFQAVSPSTFKGSLQFYMGLQVGRPTQLGSGRRRILRIKGRPRTKPVVSVPVEATTIVPREKPTSQDPPKAQQQNNDDDDD